MLLCGTAIDAEYGAKISTERKHLLNTAKWTLICFFTRVNEMRHACDRSDTAPSTASIYRQQKGGVSLRKRFCRHS